VKLAAALAASPVLLAFVPLSSAADTVMARVIRVHDGDSITARVGEQKVRLRLAWIDADELAQPYGRQARVALCSMVCGRDITIEIVDTDRKWGRPVVLVWVQGEKSESQVLVNAEMVRIGAAWVYRSYYYDPALDDIERDAREHGRGQWSGLEAPWIYRSEAHEH